MPRRTPEPPGISREELEVLVRGYRHLLEERRRAHAESRVRHHLETRLRKVEARFERLLDEWVVDEEARSDWRAHLYGEGPQPPQPAAVRALVFRGRAENGSVVEIRRRADGDCDVEVDGHLAERLRGSFDLSAKNGIGSFTVDGQDFQEVFSTSGAALTALSDFVAERKPQPPWEFAAELVADGLVDRNFGLTSRGCRALSP